MSNVVVGNIYAQIIERIIDAARNDFEEAAVDGKVLTELKEQWQQNLTKLNVAHCPWDPVPQQPQLANPPTLPSNASKAAAAPAPGAAQVQAAHNGGVQVKSEPKYDGGAQNYPINGYSSIGQGINPMAAQRAQHLVAQQYGQAASAAIQAPNMPQQPMARPLALPGQQQRPGHMQMPGQAQRQPQQQQYAQQPNDMKPTQLDGAGDAARLEADSVFLSHAISSADAIESGVFAPINQKSRKNRSAIHRMKVEAVAGPSSAPGSSPGVPSIRQLDGADDEDDKAQIKRDEEDEDAINSDLDDDDELDGQAEEEGDGPVGETILCTYDKVQRVKNKWKCTLKDGILTTGTREYVFHKANGEFEW